MAVRFTLSDPPPQLRGIINPANWTDNRTAALAQSLSELVSSPVSSGKGHLILICTDPISGGESTAYVGALSAFDQPSAPADVTALGTGLTSKLQDFVDRLAILISPAGSGLGVRLDKAAADWVFPPQTNF